ncbi:FHA domain-containing protein [Rhodococcus sp. CX]|uniref:FHA domain-containing protein n=1 Tax=Rhodococcus sp. CX TaxID=2789880 RepID=UPI0018CE9623|nr:FHA domain-containing protein [Rhodococcus sp. CX]MBH0123751.1 FHA domain-containing protein [Rhodococcus sp. CX]
MDIGNGRVVIEWEGGRTVVDAPDQVRIGRDEAMDITIADPMVSREHARVLWDDGWYVTDSDSKNGTFVDGHRVDRIAVTDSVVVRCGGPFTAPSLKISVADPSATRTRKGMIEQWRTMRADDMRPAPRRKRRPLEAGARSIGRDRTCDIVVNDVLVSRVHAALHTGPSGLEIEDLGSVNGTYVDGKAVTRTPLRDGDVVTIGNTDLVVHGDRLVPRQEEPSPTVGLRVHGVGLTISGGQRLLDDVSLSAPLGTLTAVIGPSGAGKSTVARIISGTTGPTDGVVEFEGHDVHSEYEALRSRIGLVPQDDVVHRQLTVRQALGYAAELRLPPDTTRSDRDEAIANVLAELQLTEHADTRVDHLSGGQRKRASVALELLTGPSLLILDEPTSGLDPALDRQIMATLRRLADLGRVILVITHSLSYLEMCDQVLLLAPGGKTAYVGPPAQVGSALGSTDWAEIFARVAAEPDAVYADHLARSTLVEQPPATEPGPLPQPAQTSRTKQLGTVARRQLRLIRADRGYLIFLSVLPFVLGGLTILVPGDDGFGFPSPGEEPGELSFILILLILGACFMGLSLTVRDLVGERQIYFRERAAGLQSSAYLWAKILVFCAAAIVQSVVLVLVVMAGKGAPGPGSLIPVGAVELMVDIALTTCSCVVLGLALSAVARSSEQVMPMLVVAVMVQLVMSGGLIPITGRVVLEQLSWLFSARWGYAASASTVDLRAKDPTAEADALWQHTASAWLLNIGMLVLVGVVLALFAYSRLRLRGRRSARRRELRARAGG